jgi:hydrogenase 3 maturation protease
MCWQAQLRETLTRLEKPEQRARVAILGIGHELCGDDAAGLWLARKASEAVQALGGHSQAVDHLLVLEAGAAPENTCGALRRFRPDLVLLTDAAQLHEKPGMLRWLDWQVTGGISASTHTLPLHLFAAYLVSELQCEVALLGIQPEHTIPGQAMTPAVRQAAEAAAKIVVNSILKQDYPL